MTDQATIEAKRADGRVLAMVRWLEEAPLHRAERPRGLQVAQEFTRVAPGWNTAELLVAMLTHISTLRQIIGDEHAPITPKPEPLPARRRRAASRTPTG